jgi:5-methylcytosine-specific restriction endonuclease McrA
MHKRTKKTAISMKVKLTVWERDNHCCILCGRRGDPVCHYIPRSQGGLGIETNIVTLCPECHQEMDNGKNGEIRRRIVEAYLREHYPEWTREAQIYKKGM